MFLLSFGMFLLLLYFLWTFRPGIRARAFCIRITGQNMWTKRRDIIDQNEHLLSNMETWECHQMKIIKGKWFILMPFLTFVTPLLVWKMAVWVSVAWSWPNIIAVCFRHKAFLKSDSAVALRRNLSIIPCLTLVSFINVYDEYFCYWCGSLHFHRMFAWDNAPI
jgi:hypothetical protein